MKSNECIDWVMWGVFKIEFDLIAERTHQCVLCSRVACDYVGISVFLPFQRSVLQKKCWGLRLAALITMLKNRQ